MLFVTYKRVIVGLLAWLAPAPDAIRGRITQSEKEQVFRIAFGTYVFVFAALRQVYKWLGHSMFGSENSPTIAAIMAVVVYVLLYLYRLGQGVPSYAHRPRVLLVEDDEATAGLMVRLLKSGWDVVSVTSINQALIRLKEGYTWVLLDLILPDGEGNIILRKVRHDRLKTKVAVLTGLAAGPSYDEMLRLKPDVLVKKPINFDELVVALEKKNGSKPG
jgi:CheY-like chemotaxis protein